MAYVHVSGWSTSRQIIEENGKILFEVAEADGCPACRSRIEHVKLALTQKNISAEFQSKQSLYGRCLYVVLDPPAEGVDIKNHVGRLLNLVIY